MPIRKKEPVKKSPVFSKAEEYIKLQSQIKKLTEQANEIKEELREVVNKRGYKNTHGHIYLDVFAGETEINLVNECRVSASLKVNAIDVLEKKFNRRVAGKYIETIRVVREEKLRAAIEKGEVPKTLAKSLYDISESYAFKTPKYAKGSKTTKKD